MPAWCCCYSPWLKERRALTFPTSLTVKHAGGAPCRAILYSAHTFSYLERGSSIHDPPRLPATTTQANRPPCVFLVLHLPTYLPTYQPTRRQPTASLSPPNPPRLTVLLFVCVRALSSRSRLASTACPPLAPSHRLGLLSSLSLSLSLSLFLPPLLFPPPGTVSRPCLSARHSDRSRPRRARSLAPCPPLLHNSRHAALLTDIPVLNILSAYSPPYTQPPPPPPENRLVSPRATPSHDSPRHPPRRSATARSEPRLTNLLRERSLIFRFVHEAIRQGEGGGISHASREDLDKEHQTIAGRC